MNMNKLFVMTLTTAVIAFAQQAPVAQSAAPAPAPATAPADPEAVPATASAAPEATSASAPVAPESKETPAPAQVATPAQETAPVEPAKPEPVTPKEPSAFDVLHGSAYNSVGNEAAADNVDALLGSPDKFFGKKFFYIEPAAERGVISLGSFFAAMDVSGDLGRATAGYAMDGFGAEVRVSLGQFAIDGDNGKKSGSLSGDDWGLTLSKVLGGYVVLLDADWITQKEENNVEPKVGKSTEEAYRDLNVTLSASNGPSAVKHFWTAGVGFTRHENEQKVGGDVMNDDVDSHIKFSPFFNYGTVALQTVRARLLLGANASVPVSIYDEQDIIDTTTDASVTTSLFNVGVVVSPNILGEVLLGTHVMLFGEANYKWRVFDFTSGTDATDDEYTAMESVSDQVTATVGFRYQYENWVACEFAFGNSFFTDTKSIFNGEGVFVNFGGFIFF